LKKKVDTTILIAADMPDSAKQKRPSLSPCYSTVFHFICRASTIDDNGVVITKIDEGSTAQEAGLLQGDVILEANRHDVTSVDDFVKAYKKSKNSLLILIYRKGSTFYLVMRE
jgi:S1-C subfamily serine protease